MGQTLSSVLKNENLFEFPTPSQEFGSTITLISQMRKKKKGVCDMPEAKLLISGRVITNCKSVYQGTISKALVPVLTLAPRSTLASENPGLKSHHFLPLCLSQVFSPI